MQAPQKTTKKKKKSKTFASLEAMTQDAYVTRVHTALQHKHTELQLLAKWFESPEFVRGITTNARPADPTQLDHMWRRYDEALTHIGGFHYNPHRAYFDRDSYGTGVLRFEEGVSLIGSQANQNRWTLPRPIPDPSQINRSARLDAFLAMLEQRQAMAQWSGLAPICIFIGNQLPLEDLKNPCRRLPPRPVDRQIPAARYVRFCMATQIGIQNTSGYILCVSLVERSTTTLSMVTFCSGSLVTQKPQDDQWPAKVLFGANNRWAEISGMGGASRKEYKVFNATSLSLFSSSKPHSMAPHRIIACPKGDSQMIHRLGLLLESPDLDYAPWTGVPVHGSENLVPHFADLDTLLTTGPALSRDQWMNYTLMGRVYPYALLGKNYMTETLRMTAYNMEVSLTKKEADTFRESIVPVPNTRWIQPKSAVKKTKKKLAPQPRPISQNALLAFVEELHGYQVGELHRLFGKAAMAWKYQKGPSATTLLNQGRLKLPRIRAEPKTRRHLPRYKTRLRTGSAMKSTEAPKSPAGIKAGSRYQKHPDDLLSPCLQRSLEHPGIRLHLKRLGLQLSAT